MVRKRQFYCRFCNRRFKTQEALNQHRDSDKHANMCDFEPHGCGNYFNSFNELWNHCAKTNHGICCKDCEEGEGYIHPTLNDMAKEHAGIENACEKCPIHLNCRDDHHRHIDTHLERKIECLNCTARFKTNSAMLQHMEQSQTCPTSDTHILRLFKTTARFAESIFLASNQWNTIFQGRYEDLFKQPVLMCPQKHCHETFFHLSDLLLHLEVGACRLSKDVNIVRGLMKVLAKTK